MSYSIARMKPPILPTIRPENNGEKRGQSLTSFGLNTVPATDHHSSRRPRRHSPLVGDSSFFYTRYEAFATMTITAALLCILSSSISVSGFTTLNTSTQRMEQGIVSLLSRHSQQSRLYQQSSSKDDQRTATLSIFGQRLPTLPKTSPFGTLPATTTTSYSSSPRTTSCLYLSSPRRSGNGNDGTATPPADQQEWKAVVMALQLYKAAYGDLKVPTLFVVPSMAPWPESAWGMKLGIKVGAIRNNGLHISNNEQRRQQLEKLGFIWRVRAATKSAVDSKDYTIPFDQIYDSLVVYRNEIKPSGSLTVPLEFTVPDAEPWPENTRGLPLGRSVEQLRSNSYLKQYPGAKEKLEEIGFETDKKLSANDARFQAVYLALERYKDIYGDLLVPQPFVVPTDSDDWPKESWGLRLGARVNAIRSQGTFVKDNAEREDMLDALGFVWTPPEKDVKKRGRKSLVEIDLEEKEVFEASRNSRSTVGPGSPEMAGGYVGDAEQDLDGDNSFFGSFDFSDRSRDGMEGDSQSGAKTWGLEAGRQYDGSMAADPNEESNDEVDEEYISPRTLGESLAEARERALESGIIEDSDSKRPTKRKREPDFPWYNDDFGGDFVFEDVVEALTLYKQFYGSFSNLTNDEFVIPFMSEPGPAFDDDLDYDADLSIKAVEVTRFDTLDAETEISNYENSVLLQQQGEAGNVAAVAPIADVDWPEHLEGMRLGSLVQRIREGSLEVKHLPERKAQLDAIDFDWGDPLRFLEIPFEKAMCAMYAYYLVRGDMFVPADFIMPDEDPWPKALAGYEIGQVVKRIRELQNFFEAFHTEKVALLRMIDFVWFPTLALPIDPNEAEFDNEMLILGALGHPDIANLPEIPMGLPEKIMADGPFWTGDDPKQWWRRWHNWDYVAGLWYQLGKRDNAWSLRQRGMYRMAAEHEEKYGPGLFYYIDEFLDSLPDLLENDVVVNLDKTTKDEYLTTIDGYLRELDGCTDQYNGIFILKLLKKRLDPPFVDEMDTDKGAKGKRTRKDKQSKREGVDGGIQSVFGRYTEEEVEDDFQEESVDEDDGEEEMDDVNGTADDEDEYVDVDDEEYLDFEEDLGLEHTAEEEEIET